MHNNPSFPPLKENNVRFDRDCSEACMTVTSVTYCRKRPVLKSIIFNNSNYINLMLQGVNLQSDAQGVMHKNPIIC